MCVVNMYVCSFIPALSAELALISPKIIYCYVMLLDRCPPSSFSTSTEMSKCTELQKHSLRD